MSDNPGLAIFPACVIIGCLVWWGKTGTERNNIMPMKTWLLLLPGLLVIVTGILITIKTGNRSYDRSGVYKPARHSFLVSLIIGLTILIGGILLIGGLWIIFIVWFFYNGH